MLLSRAVCSYVGDQQQAQSTPDGERGREDGGSSDTQVKDDRWKRAKLDLLAKHVVSAPTRDMEIQQYRCLTIAPDDLLGWWHSQRETYPRLSKLARAILPIPATSAPSERVFSAAGLTITSKRSQLAPSTVNKIVFVHENEHFC